MSGYPNILIARHTVSAMLVLYRRVSCSQLAQLASLAQAATRHSSPHMPSRRSPPVLQNLRRRSFIRMNINTLPLLSGASLALLAAGLAGHADVAQAAKSKKVELVHCSGVNSCKGQNDCKTASNACASHGSCKGQGFVAAPAASCTSMGGTVDKASKFSAAASKVDMIHCMGANACKGKNDCKTADNACKGQGKCKGHGFVALPKASCAKVGGTAA